MYENMKKLNMFEIRGRQKKLIYWKSWSGILKWNMNYLQDELQTYE